MGLARFAFWLWGQLQKELSYRCSTALCRSRARAIRDVCDAERGAEPSETPLPLSVFQTLLTSTGTVTSELCRRVELEELITGQKGQSVRVRWLGTKRRGRISA